MIQSSTVSPRPVNDGITRRPSDRPTRPGADESRRLDRGAPTSTSRTSAGRTSRIAVPTGTDAELWDSLSSEELEHFIRPANSALLFGAGYSSGATHSGVPRGMHLDIRA